MARLPEPASGRRVVIINVGGCRVRLAWAALARCPLARLERLRACRGRDEVLRVCDDYDASRDEFFFDRSPCAFRAIVALLRAGKLRLLRGPCALAFRDELAYWGTDEARLERCCLRRLRRREEEAAEARAGPPGSPGNAGPGRRLRDLLDDPRSGPASKLVACVSVAFVAATAVGLCLSTMPDIRAEEERGECSPKCRSLFVLETVCVAWFSFEFLLRSLRAESKCAFLRTPLNVIDLLAILPFYVSLLAGLAAGGAGAGAGGAALLERAGLALRLLRALRVLYVMRLARHSLGLRSLGLTVRRCAREFGLLLLFLCVATALFAPLVHLAERELGARRDFSSVPACYWWAVISMTTVGYGDMVPRSLPGQVVALGSILSGILLLAFPVTSIFHTFSRSYSELKEQQRRRAASPEPALREDSARSAPATEDGLQGPATAAHAGVPAPGGWPRLWPPRGRSS
ncbi:potassium voltage-gated channel subfamily G member 2 [Mustela erminea]|uniref:potassium voltage-gated channel subfamily G member 2 n=1 Tax=Mustela erminea TaxID=36723 RepID=UPI001386E749|nr:potassium voltage-gated channel subfamily G member 2 [Mustela erminea]XP_032166742.1 potassium voltage-gated channel subfamily G member 2 [Mustela erminea]XP_032166743.1 potassium voltage-gated channel subfamily G member 2 [Mustela erminea]XP_032166744.1 potassium voltage-gated channel subfamily G member 2 [Mustela erminea]XP_032166745.1 potassium voltage-gated channel subfamily G member 2 [Mustela erminea]XP_032166746.1 potassium voltage-gated channel subfamily G member 2 [Mustela erminea]